MNNDKDVTDLVNFGLSDHEYLAITKCICGEEYNNRWGFAIGIYKEDAHECEKCGAKLYFTNTITVYRVEED